MKKIFTVVVLSIFTGIDGIGQIANYTFSQSASSYIALTSPTTIFTPSWDDGVSGPITIPFTFNFGDANYTSCRVSTNGFITFGNTAPATTTYYPILSTENYDGSISALGMDLYSNGGSGGNIISYKTLNSAPNRVFVIQWKNAYRYSASGKWNFQIRLNETTNAIDIIYGSCSASNYDYNYLAQIGLRGTTNKDFNDLGLPTNTSWLNNVTNIGNQNSTGVQTRSDALPASGTKFTWTPPASWACTPTHDYNDDENIITLVQFVGMVTDATNNSGNANTSAYQDFTGLTPHASQEQGEAVNLNVFANTSSTLWNAWVDWNQDGDFNDAGEEVYNTNGTYTVSTSFGFQIPLSTPPGDYRIRIRTADYETVFGPIDGYNNSDILPCNNLANGQAEDYIFTVIARCNAGIISTKNDTVCSSAPAAFTLSATGNAQATGFNWYSSQYGGSSLGTGNTFTTPSLSSTTTYWVSATGLNTSNAPCESQIRVPAIAFKPTVPTISFDQPDPSYICNGDNLSVKGTSSSETAYLINEGFEDGTLGEFTVTNNISPNGNVTGSMPWHIENSVYVPVTSAVWRPAISSGFGSNNFAFALSDTSYMEIDPWNYRTYHTFLTSQPHNTTGYTSLNLAFKLFFDHYLADNVESELDTVTVQASINGTTWNTIDKFIADQGEASDFKSYNYVLNPGTYLNQSNVQVRFVFGATWTNGVAIDSIVLYGDHPATSAYTWTQVGGFVDPQHSCLYTTNIIADTAGMAYNGGSTQNIYLFPTDAQVDDGTPLQFEATLNLSNGCTVSDDITVNIDDKRWTAGAGTNDWFTAANWCGNQVPQPNDRVTIPDLSPGTIYPLIKMKVNTNAKSKYLTIEPNANVTIDDGGLLEIKRDLFTDAGATFTNNGTLNFDGIKNGVAQNFPGPGTIAEMNNLTIGNSGTPPAGSSNVILNAPISIRGDLKDSLGTLELGNNDITLKSYSTGTAFIDKINDNSAGFNLSGTGRFVVERFIPARRAWRFLTTPMYSTTQTISDAWQEGQVNLTQPGSCPVPVPPGLEHYGMFITNTQPPMNGYDWNTTNNPSLKYWGNNDWAAPSGTNISILNYPAYCVFVRGDRQICIQYATSAVPDSTVLRVKGFLNEPGSTGLNKNGPVTRSYTGTPGDMIFVGNPFAASVDISTVLTNFRSPGIVSQKAWFWNPNSNGPSGYNVGAYVTYSGGVWAPDTSSYPQDLIIRSGEAFFVQMATGQTSASINFKQNDKIPASESGIFGPKSFVKKTQEPRVLYVNLLSNNDSASAIVDGVATAFGKNYSAAIDDRDATKMWNMDESMALYRDNKFLAIEFRPMPQLTDTLFYKMYLYKEHSYTLQIFTQDLPGPKPMRAWLIDKYLGTQTEINLYDTLLYNFASTDDTISYRDRFIIVFNKQLPTIPVAVSKAANQEDPNTIGITSEILKGKISISPNPVTSAKNALLLFDNVAKGNYEIIVYSSKGEKLAVKQVQHAGNKASYSLPQGNAWTAGVYMVRVVSDADNRQSADLKLVINR